MKKSKKIFKWILTVLLGLEFILAGQAKFTSSGVWMKQFDRWGYPDHFYLVIGVLEVAVGIIIFFPKHANKAILGGIVIMVGAALTHVFNSEASRSIPPIIISGLLLVVFYLNKALVKKES